MVLLALSHDCGFGPNLLQSVVVKAKDENKILMNMDEKVEMVDNLVNLFIKGNAIRAKQSNKNFIMKSPASNPVTEKIREIQKSTLKMDRIY